MTAKREQAREHLLRSGWTPGYADAILDAIEIMGQPGPEERTYCPACLTDLVEPPTAEPAPEPEVEWATAEVGRMKATTGAWTSANPEPEEPLDTRVCRALGQHRTAGKGDACGGPDGSWAECFQWSTSELGVGAMMAWLHEQGVGALALANERANVREGRWRVSYFSSLNGGSRDYIQGDSPQAALANAVAACSVVDNA